MTRETKIGLLVGLAFIIVIGILLSDHLTSATEPPQAELAQAGGNVRSAVSTPGGSAVQAPAVTPPTMVAPQQQVLTREEMNPKPVAPPVQIVHIGPGNPPVNNVTITPPAQTPTPIQQPQTSPTLPTEVASNEPPITKAPEVPAKSALTEVAKAFNEQIVAVPARTENPTGVALQSESATNTRQYKAEPGDSVSRLAARFLNGNTPENRDAIVKANPSLQQDANKIIIGKTYNIPLKANVAPVIATNTTTPSPAKPAASAAGAGEYIYTVKAGDSLSKIALEQLGSVTTIPAIKELNKDILKDENAIVVNMKLRMPAKPIASIQ